MTTVNQKNTKEENVNPKLSKQKEKKTRRTKADIAEELLFEVPKDIQLKSEWIIMVRWHSMTKLMRKSAGLTNNVKAYAISIGITDYTIMKWRQRDDFWDMVQKQQKLLFKAEYMGEMFHAMYRKSLKDGDSQKVKLMAQYVGAMKEEAIVLQLPPELQEIRDKVRDTLPK